MQEFNYRVITNGDELAAALATLTQQESIGVDTETTGLDPFTSRVRLIQLGYDNNAFILDLFRTPELAEPLRAIFAAQQPIKIFHNAKFDLKMLKRHFGFEVNSVFDTMLASQLIQGGREGENHSLASVAQRFLNFTVDKTEQQSNWGGELTESQLRYAAFDAIVAQALYKAQIIKIIELNILDTCELEFDTVAPIANMELSGILLDVQRWQAIIKVVEQKRDEMAAKLRASLEPGNQQMSLFGESNINLDSPSQVLDTLKRLGIPLTGTRSAQLHPFAREFPVVEELLEYRSLQKALTSYGTGMFKFIHKVTGRIHADFRQIGTPTGRMACHEPNIQQIPNTVDYRNCFVAPPGHRMIIADYSQIELRILADWSVDAVLIDALTSGKDLHKVTASQMFGIPLESVTPAHRAAAKQLNYGIVYGMGAPGLAARIDSSLSDAERLIERYFATYAGVARWLRAAGEQAVSKGQCRTKLGRLMYIDFDKEDQSSIAQAIRLGKNMPIQGTSADITKRAMMLLHKSLANSSARIINSIHDELVIEVAESEAVGVAQEVETQMVAAGREFIEKVPVTVDVKIAEAWVK